jgi:hypothetical protein
VAQQQREEQQQRQRGLRLECEQLEAKARKDRDVLRDLELKQKRLMNVHTNISNINSATMTGSALLSLCGGTLSSGTSAELELANATPNMAAWLVVGSTSAPTPLLGGTIVPLPIEALLFGATDAGGVWSFPAVPGGGGPFTLYCQAVYVDLGQSEGVGISNALKADFLP